MEDNKVYFIETYDLDEQVEDLSKSTGISKRDIRRVLLQQRKHIQNKCRLGYAINLVGIGRIDPKEKGDIITLVSKVAQAVPRPITIRKVEANKSPQESKKLEIIEDDELM